MSCGLTVLSVVARPVLAKWIWYWTTCDAFISNFLCIPFGHFGIKKLFVILWTVEITGHVESSNTPTFDRLKGHYGAAVSIRLGDLQSSVRVTKTYFDGDFVVLSVPSRKFQNNTLDCVTTTSFCLLSKPRKQLIVTCATSSVVKVNDLVFSFNHQNCMIFDCCYMSPVNWKSRIVCRKCWSKWVSKSIPRISDSSICREGMNTESGVSQVGCWGKGQPCVM